MTLESDAERAAQVLERPDEPEDEEEELCGDE